MEREKNNSNLSSSDVVSNFNNINEIRITENYQNYSSNSRYHFSMSGQVDTVSQFQDSSKVQPG